MIPSSTLHNLSVTSAACKAACAASTRESRPRGRELLKQVSAAQEDDGASLPTVPLDATQAEDILYAILLA